MKETYVGRGRDRLEHTFADVNGRRVTHSVQRVEWGRGTKRERTRAADR